MPSKKAYTGFTAGRAINLLGTVYAKGAAIPTAVVARVKNASSLLSRGWIVPANSQYPRKGERLDYPAPRTIGARERRDLGA